MKKLNFLVLAGCLSVLSLRAQTADDYVAQGRRWLGSNDLVRADAQFNQALALDANHSAANALAAATRLLVLPQKPAGSNFLNRIGFSKTGRNLFDWTATLPENSQGHTILPANFSSTEAIAVFRTNIMPAITASRANLARITDTNFTLSLTAAETSSESVTIDFGDILLLRALLYGGDFLGYTANAHNFAFVLNHIKALGDANLLSIQQILVDYPSLLAKGSATELAASKAALTNGAALYQAASDFIRRRPATLQRLFNLAAQDVSKEADFRDYLAKTVQSLDGPVQLKTDSPVAINAASYFAGTKSLRSLLPRFSGNLYVQNSLPDYTFGGILLYEPAWKTEEVLRKKLAPTTAGIYLGNFYPWSSGSASGSFAMFVGASRNAVVMGYDSSAGAGLAISMKVDSGGSWDYQSSSLYTRGEISSDGTLNGELGNNNGWWEVSGDRQSNFGTWQGSAGLYSGTWTSSGRTGRLQGILSAAGQIFYAAFDTSGAVTDGGSGQINGQQKFTSVSVSYSTIAGTLNAATAQITGFFTNSDGHGTFAMTRSGQIVSDQPPTLTKALTDKTVVLGANATLAVTVSGSAPLCYQWYSNDVAIVNANAASLTISNVHWASDGTTYRVTIANIVQGISSSALLHVVPETNRPALKITAPTNGQRWSNALFAVTITATDNVGVSNVWCQLNGGTPALAQLANTRWTLNAPLSAGTNFIRAWAVDTCGNVSPTNSVSLIYVLTSPITLLTNGIGTITRSFAGTQLEIGKRYTVTAVPGAGQLFSNWVGTATSAKPALTFMMESNLWLQANFVPNPFRAVKGTYNGLFAAPADDAATRQHESSGCLLNLLVTDRGTFSGSLWLAGASYPVRGQFDVGGNVNTNVARTGTSPLTLNLSLNLTAGADHLSGTVSDGHWIASLEADRQVFNATTNRSGFAGKYTLFLPGQIISPASPGGDSSAALTIDPAGKVTTSGWLADGTAWAPLATTVSRAGLWPLYASVYSGKGSVWAWITFDTNQPPADLHGTVSWIKPAIATAKLYPLGFTNVVLAEGSRYVSPTTNRVIHLTNGIVVFDGGTLATPVTNLLTLKANNQILIGTNLLIPGLTPSSGLFSGKTTIPTAAPAGKLSVTIQGALFQDSDVGYGYFLSTNNQGGRIFLGPATP